MANFIGQTIKIPGIGNATVTSVGQYTNTPGFDIFTDKGNFIYYDSSYVNKGLVKDGQQWISPELLGYVQNKEAAKVDFSSFGDVPKSTKGGITVDGNGYLFTNPSAFDVNPTIFGLSGGIKEISGISADSNGNLSYKGGGSIDNGSYSSSISKTANGWYLQTDTQTKSGGGGFFGDIGGFIGSAFNSVSDFLGTSGGGGGILGGLASIDPGPGLGAAAATLDKAVTDTVPGGWATVAAVAATIASAGTASPLLAAEAAGEAAAVGLGEAAAIGGTEVAAIGAGEAAAIDSTAAALGGSGGGGAFTAAAGSGASFALPEAIAGAAIGGTEAAGGTGLTGGAGGSTGLLTGGTTAGLTIPTEAAIAVDPAIAAGSGAGIGGTGAAAGGGLSAVGEISAGLPAAGSTGGAGTGLSAELAPNTIIGTGANGGAIGGTYLAGADGMVATDLLGNAIPASSVGMGGIDSAAGLSAADIASNANRLKNIAKLLGGSGSRITGRSAPTAQQWATQAGQNLTQATPAQFGGLYEMNKNPFTFSNPLANALAGKSTSGLDVSGTGGTSLQSSTLAKLLA